MVHTGQSQQQDSGPGVPAIPRWPQCWVTSTGWETQRWLEKNEAGGSGEGCAVKLALGTTCLRLPVFMGTGKGTQVCPHWFTICLKGLDGSLSVIWGTLAAGRR